jgi:hypothetical protein
VTLLCICKIQKGQRHPAFVEGKSVAYPQINLGVIHRLRLPALELGIKN